MKPLIMSNSVPRITFNDFISFSVDAVFRADVPMIITEITISREINHADLIVNRLGDDNVTLFQEGNNKQNTERWKTTRIKLRCFFEDERYQNDSSSWYRIVSNIMHRPEEVNHLLGFDAFSELASQRSLNAVNLWVSFRRVFTQSHFDELENFNVALQGRKKIYPPPRKDVIITLDPY